MAATIIPFPTRGSDRPRPPPLPAGSAAHGPAATATRDGPDRPAPSGPWPARAPLPGPTLPAVAGPYTGPCRRVRGFRGMTTLAPALPLAPPAATPPPDRMARALEGLRSALSQQAAVVAAWRSSLGELDRAIGSLQRGVAQHGATTRALQAQASRPAGDAEPSRRG